MPKGRDCSLALLSNGKQNQTRRGALLGFDSLSLLYATHMMERNRSGSGMRPNDGAQRADNRFPRVELRLCRFQEGYRAGLRIGVGDRHTEVCPVFVAQKVTSDLDLKGAFLPLSK